jgi:hypothetical protein
MVIMAKPSTCSAASGWLTGRLFCSAATTSLPENLRGDDAPQPEKNCEQAATEVRLLKWISHATSREEVRAFPFLGSDIDALGCPVQLAHANVQLVGFLQFLISLEIPTVFCVRGPRTNSAVFVLKH